MVSKDVHSPESELFGWRYLELCVIGHHALESNTNTLDDSKEDSTHDRGVSGSFNTTTDGEGTTGEETSDDSVPWIFLLAHALDGAVVLEDD